MIAPLALIGLLAPEWTVTAEAMTDFPLQIGAGARVEGPHGLRAHTSLGWLPGPYLDTINAVAVEIGGDEGYTEDDAELVKSVLENSLIWRIGAGWRPFEGRGFYFEGGYTLVTLGGSTTSAVLLSSITGRSIPTGSADRTYEAAATDHLLGAELGWQWDLDEHIVLRAALGGAFTISASASVKQKGGGGNRLVAAFEDYSEDYLVETFESYVHMPLLTVAGGWRF